MHTHTHTHTHTHMHTHTVYITDMQQTYVTDITVNSGGIILCHFYENFYFVQEVLRIHVKMEKLRSR